MAGFGGKRPGAGRPKGRVNRLSRVALEAFELAFDAIGGADALAKWAKKNRTEFYKLYARRIPVTVQSSGELRIRVVYDDKNPNAADE